MASRKPSKWARIGWALVIALAIAMGFVLWTMTQIDAPIAIANTAHGWRIAAPGIVQSQFPDVRLAAAVQAKIDAIVVKPGESVADGDLLVQLDDQEEAARVRMAEANVSLRKFERDSALTGTDMTERRQAEDAIAAAEKSRTQRQSEYDLAFAKSATDPTRAVKLADSQTALAKSVAAVAAEKQALSILLSIGQGTSTTRADTVLAVAQAELAIAQAVHAKTRIRAPFSGTVLKVLKSRGEIAGPSVDDAVLVFGNPSQLHVRAELSERDIGRVKIGDLAFIVSHAGGSATVKGHVTSFAASLSPRRIGVRNAGPPLWPNVREVLIALDDTASLVPGLHVDVFFGSEAALIQGDEANAHN